MQYFVEIYRFRQARYILAVFAHLMNKTSKQDKKDYDEQKKMYLSQLIQTSDFLKGFKMSPAQAKYFEFDDTLIPCDINLPEGEDTELPIRPLVTDAEFKKVEKMLQELCSDSSLLDARDCFYNNYKSQV